jgi:hypothetical protein
MQSNVTSGCRKHEAVLALRAGKFPFSQCVDDLRSERHRTVASFRFWFADVYRRGVVALYVRSISEAARLEINARGTGFISRPGVRRAPYSAPTELAALPS